MDELRLIIDTMKEVESDLHTKADNTMSDAQKMDKYLELLDKARAKYQIAEDYYHQNDMATILSRYDIGTERLSRNHPTPGRPNNQVFQEILEEAGKPLYLDDILTRAVRRGVKFKGTKNPPRKQLRTSLNGSKRFALIGPNTWWLADRPVPGQENSDSLQ